MEDTEILDASFDLVARQDATDAAVETLRTDVEENRALMATQAPVELEPGGKVHR